MVQERIAETGEARPDPAAGITAGLFVADQIAAVLMADRQVCRELLMGEPVERVMAVVRWVLECEDDDGCDPEGMLVKWARRRGVGPFAPMFSECAACGDRRERAELVEVREGGHDGMVHRDGDLVCGACARRTGVLG